MEFLFGRSCRVTHLYSPMAELILFWTTLDSVHVHDNWWCCMLGHISGATE